MTRQEKRAAQRFPYRHDVVYIALGREGHPSEREETRTEMLDISDNGMRLRIDDRKFEEGSLLLVRVPVSEVPVSVPSLAQVRWIKEGKPGACEAGLRFAIE